MECSIVSKADFESLPAAGGCQEAPACGRRMLRVKLELSPATRSETLLHVSGSERSNDEARKFQDSVYNVHVLKVQIGICTYT